MTSIPSPDRDTPFEPAGILSRLGELARETAGNFRVAPLIEQMVRALSDLLAPDRLTVLLLDSTSKRLSVAYDRARTPTPADDPLLQLAFREGPLVYPSNVRAAARQRGVDVADPPGSWIGVPLPAAGGPVGAVSLGRDRPNAYGETELLYANAVVAQVAVALENAHLLELLSIGKYEWEITVDSISQAICIVDAHGAVRRGNRVFADLVESPVTALPGQQWVTLVPPSWKDPLAHILAEPGGPPVELRNGDRTFLASAFPMAMLAGAFVLLDEVTEKRRLQEQLIQSEKMSAIGQLIAGVAHDLNNPLASVVGFADFLSESVEVPPGLAEPLRVIRQEAERAANIVRNLLSFARRQDADRQRQPVGPLLESTIALLRNELLAHDVEVTLDIDPGVPDLELNANQMKQVFLNLLSNAVHAIAGSGRPGTIRVQVRPWLEGLAVHVIDDGPGMTEAVAHRVFEPFYTTKAEGQGTGLGLSISQGIAKEHGGRITLETAPGRGATFTVELPGSASEAPAVPAQPAPMLGSRARRVLVVDDEEPILHYMRATLTAWGHTVEVARDGREAYRRATTEPFDLIVCDLRMPRLGGRELYDTLAREHPDIAGRVIFATGDTVRGDTLRFLESLGRPFLHKPFALAELRRVLGIAPVAS
jgi:two-component system NtrC family sensor kinase